MPSRLPAKRLYLKGLGKGVTTEELTTFLSRYGTIIEVKFVHNYAFVEYESETDAQLVYNIFSCEPLLGQRVVIQFARPLRKDIIAARNRDMAENRSPLRGGSSSREGLSRHPIVVTGISPDVRWQELKDFGRSTGCLVAFCDLDRSDPDCGFLEYFTKEDAEFAVSSLDGKLLGGNAVHVSNYHDYTAERKRKRTRPRSPCRPLYPSNRANGPRVDHVWDYHPTSAWAAGPYSYNTYEGNSQGKLYQLSMQAAYHPSQPVGCSPTTSMRGLVPRGSMNESSCSEDSRYNPNGDPFYQEGGEAPSYRYDPRAGCFPDGYSH